MNAQPGPSNSPASTRRERVAVLAVTVILAVSGCAPTTSSGSPAAQPTGPLADVTFEPLPPVEEISFVSAAEAELALIAEMRADAGFAELLGADVSTDLNGTATITVTQPEPSE